MPNPHSRENPGELVGACRSVVQSEHHYQDLIESTSDRIWEVDERLRYVYVSPKVVGLLGYKPEEVLGRTPFDFMPAFEAVRLRKYVEELLRQPRPFQSLENVHLHKDGSLRTLETSGMPVFDGDGQCCGLRGIDRDITERKNVERELQAALAQTAAEHARSEAIIAAIGEGLIIVDTQFKVLYQNRILEELYGEREEDHCYVVFSDRDKICEDCPVVQTFLDGGIHRIEKSAIKDGRTVYREITASPLRDETGAIIGGVELVRDITSRKVAEEKIRTLNADLSARAAELEMANKDLEAFSYTVSHDLRGPLTNINSYCQVIAELSGDRLDSRCAGFLDSVFQEVKSMDELITSLLNLSRFSHIKLKRERVDLSEMAKAVAAELQIREPGRRVDFDIMDGVAVSADRKLLRMVLVNLFGNAWKFSSQKEHPAIRFGMAQSQEGPVYFVSDNGIGFEMSQSDKIFAVFQRLHRSDDFEGFGIGLTTARRIIERHNGRIWAEGMPGNGAKFSFTLHEKPMPAGTGR